MEIVIDRRFVVIDGKEFKQVTTQDESGNKEVTLLTIDNELVEERIDIMATKQQTVDLDHFFVKYAEGTCINSRGDKPLNREIKGLFKNKGWKAYHVVIWYDQVDSIWRWACSVKI